MPDGGIDWPVSRVLEAGGRLSADTAGSGPNRQKCAQTAGAARPVAGIQVHAVIPSHGKGVSVETVRMGGRVVGTVFEDGYARWCLLGDIRPEDASLPRAEQARRTFEMMEEALGLAGMDFSNVLRTWYYLEDILAWYGDFNAARTTFFSERGIFDGVVPASTGIGGSNPASTAILTEALALAPIGDRVRVEAVPSPMQCPALKYGSSFSRAVEISMPDHRRLLISGTASIGPGGETRHVGDLDSQIDLTMRVVHAILESRGMDWPCATRAICYVKPGQSVSAFDAYCATHGLTGLPVVVVQNDICREELLFEIQVDAVLRV